MIVLVLMLITYVLWRWVYHRGYTVSVRNTVYEWDVPTGADVRLPDQMTAYLAAAQLTRRLAAQGVAALQSDWADVTRTADGR